MAHKPYAHRDKEQNPIWLLNNEKKETRENEGI